MKKTIEIRDFLLKNGIYANILGFNYLIDAVEIVKKDLSVKVTKEVYPTIAAKYGVKTSNVERAIRHIIQKLPLAAFKSVGIRWIPTNSELIWHFAMEVA